MPSYPAGYHNAFIAWQVIAMWHQGRLPTADLIVYLNTLEGFYPEEAFLNFNKAILCIKSGQFNEAMRELKEGRKKDPYNSLSVVLQFWIAYFSGDMEWRQHYKIIKENGLLPAPVLRLVDAVEAISSKQPSPLYLSPRKDDFQLANRELLKNFPELKIEKSSDRKNVLMVAADSGYLHKFVFALLLSAKELPERSFGLHVHVYQPKEGDMAALQAFDQKYPELCLSYSWEEKSPALPSNEAPYYACMRFCRAAELLSGSDTIERLALVDADSLLRQDPFRDDRVSSADVVLCRHEWAPPWDRFAAGFSVFCRSSAGQSFLACIANILLENFAAGKQFWLIDQVALFDAFNTFDGVAKTISLEPVFGKNMEHGQESFFWTYTNDDKTRDNPMNREKARLLKAAGVVL